MNIELPPGITSRRVNVIALAISMMFVSPSPAKGDELPEKITVATWNLEWFYDYFKPDNSSDLSKEKAAPTRADWGWKRRHVAEIIGKLKPTILCLQEVENRDVIYKLLKDVEQEYGIKYRYALIDGYDFATDQDVVIIYQSGLVEYSRREQSREMFDSGEYYNLSKHLIARFEWGSGIDRQSLVVFNCHLRAGAETFELRRKQGRLIHSWMSGLAEDEPNRKDLVFASAAVYRDLVIQGEVDANHFDDYYNLPADQRDISDHYPMMSEFLVK